MNTEYFENETTKLLSDICKKAGCPNTDVKICLDDLTFFDQNNEGNWLTFHYDGKKWILGTRSMSKWNGKIIKIFSFVLNCNIILHVPCETINDC